MNPPGVAVAEGVAQKEEGPKEEVAAPEAEAQEEKAAALEGEAMSVGRAEARGPP